MAKGPVVARTRAGTEVRVIANLVFVYVRGVFAGYGLRVARRHEIDWVRAPRLPEADRHEVETMAIRCEIAQAPVLVRAASAAA